MMYDSEHVSLTVSYSLAGVPVQLNSAPSQPEAKPKQTGIKLVNRKLEGNLTV